MKRICRFFLMISLVFLATTGLHAQKLQVGGRIGMSQVKSVGENQDSKNGSRSSGYAGIFANYLTRNFRMGIQVELNYLGMSKKTEAEFRLPVTGFVNLDRRSRVRLHAGTFIGVGQTLLDSEWPTPARGLEWGLTSGLDVRVPVNEHLILVADTRANCVLPANGMSGGIGIKPFRRILLSVSLGIAFGK
ncbi:MAG: hypothetical protein R3D00_12425 [Bacteroidia bacterium]